MSVQYHIISKTRKMVMPKPQNLRKLGKEKKQTQKKAKSQPQTFGETRAA